MRFSAISRTNYQPLTNKFLRDFCSKIVFQQPQAIALKTPVIASMSEGGWAASGRASTRADLNLGRPGSRGTEVSGVAPNQVSGTEIDFSNSAHIASCALEPSGSAADMEVVIRYREQSRGHEHTDCLCLVDENHFPGFRNQVVLDCDRSGATNRRHAEDLHSNGTLDVACDYAEGGVLAESAKVRHEGTSHRRTMFRVSQRTADQQHDA